MKLITFDGRPYVAYRNPHHFTDELTCRPLLGGWRAIVRAAIAALVQKGRKMTPKLSFLLPMLFLLTIAASEPVAAQADTRTDLVTVTDLQVAVKRSFHDYWHVFRIIVWTPYRNMPAEQPQYGRRWQRHMDYRCQVFFPRYAEIPRDLRTPDEARGQGVMDGIYAYVYAMGWRGVRVYRQNITQELVSACR